MFLIEISFSFFVLERKILEPRKQNLQEKKLLILEVFSVGACVLYRSA